MEGRVTIISSRTPTISVKSFNPLHEVRNVLIERLLIKTFGEIFAES